MCLRAERNQDWAQEKLNCLVFPQWPQPVFFCGNSKERGTRQLCPSWGSWPLSSSTGHHSMRAVPWDMTMGHSGSLECRGSLREGLSWQLLVPTLPPALEWMPPSLGGTRNGAITHTALKLCISREDRFSCCQGWHNKTSWHKDHIKNNPSLLLSHVCLSATPWHVTHQVALSMEFSRHGYWNGLPFPTLGDLLDPQIEPVSPVFPALAGRFFTTSASVVLF